LRPQITQITQMNFFGAVSGSWLIGFAKGVHWFGISPQRRKDAMKLSLMWCGSAEIDGGTAGDLAIAGHRWEARLLRTRAFVTAELPTGRHAYGASVPPSLSRVWKGGTFRQLLEKQW